MYFGETRSQNRPAEGWRRGRKRTAFILMGVMLIAEGALTGVPQNASANSTPDPRSQEISAILDSLVAAGAPGAIIRVKTPDFDYSEARGVFARDTKRPLKSTDLLRIASISKTYFGVLASILHEQGVINLDAPLGSTFPEIAAKFTRRFDPDGSLRDPKAITLRELLSHTAGITDPILPDAGFTPYYMKQMASGQPLDRAVALKDIFNTGLLYKPGTQQQYSNGGYILASYIIEQVTKHPYWVDMRKQILDPLGLTDTYNGSAENFDLSRLAHGYNHLVVPKASIDISDWQMVDQGNGFANGGLVSTVDDLAKFFRAIFKDPSFPVRVDKQKFLKTFLPNETTRLMGSMRYQNGIALDREGCYSHAGHFFGYIGSAMYCPAQDLMIVVEVTSDSGNLNEIKNAKVSDIKKIWILTTDGGGAIGG